MMRSDHVDPVFAAARAHARDRYLSALLCPAGERDDLVALAAVLGEIERIPALVTEPLMGEIRLQWWADWLETLAQPSAASQAPATRPETGNPLADAFAETLRRRALPTDGLARLVEARILDLYADPPSDAAAYAHYVEATEGGPFRLAAAITGADPAVPEAEAAIRAAGRAYGGVRILLKLPFFVARGRWPFVPPEAGDAPLAAGEAPAVIRERAVREEMEAIARAAGQVRALIAALPAAHAARLRRALRPIALVEPYLRHVEVAKPWTLAPCPDLADLTRVWRLWTAKYLNRP